MLPIDFSALAKWGTIIAGTATLFIWLQSKFRKAERYEKERAINEILGKNNTDLKNIIVESQKRESEFAEIESLILNDPDSVDTSSLLNSYDYGDEVPPPRKIQQSGDAGGDRLR